MKSDILLLNVLLRDYLNLVILFSSPKPLCNVAVKLLNSFCVPLQQWLYFSEEESELVHMIKLNSMQSVLKTI